MIKIGKLTDYALLITNYFVTRNNKLCTNDEISHATHLPIATVRKLLKKLVDAKLVTSFRGIKGGYKLSIVPENISITQVIVAVEGPISITECAINKDNCNYSNECNLKENWSTINNLFINTLDNINLIDMSTSISEQPVKFNLPGKK